MNLHFSRRSIALAAVVAAAALSGCATAKFDDDQQSLLKAAKRAGATAVEARQYDDGGMQLSGELEGRAFALSIPWRWNRQAVLYASGYSIPGTPLKIPDNALRDDRIGLSRTPYAERFAVGRSAYDKAGMGVQTAVENTWRLKQFMDRLGTSKVYVIGGSMGGSITMALIEKHPDAFAGAIAACGVVGDWQAELGYAIDVRAAYNYFTRGTAYELPGEKSVARSALSTFSSGPLHWTWPLPQLIQAKRLIKPVLRLFDAAAANPQGPERRIIDNIAATARSAVRSTTTAPRSIPAPTSRRGKTPPSTPESNAYAQTRPRWRTPINGTNPPAFSTPACSPCTTSSTPKCPAASRNRCCAKPQRGPAIPAIWCSARYPPCASRCSPAS